MIIGIGIDIIEVARIQNAIAKNPRFSDRVFTEREIQYSQGKKNRFQHLAARFAVKEAFFKASGRRIGWTEVETVNLPSGRPQLVIHAEGDFGFTRSQVSISHLVDHALAVVILETD
ncbi:MAG: holo-ACP synthase [Candidatus Aminicenantales bacterium]